jgi:hypothetical protein
MSEYPCIDSQFIADLYEAFNDMAEAKFHVVDAIKADQGKYDVFVANSRSCKTDRNSDKAREAAILSLTQFYKGSESIVDAGLLCASEETVETLKKFNETKQHFKAAVMKIREEDEKRRKRLNEPKVKLPGKHIAHLLSERILEHGFRSDMLQKAMSTAGIGELDLKKCYAEIRIMPKNLDVFCWTWATKHSRTRQISLEDARKKVNEYFEDNHDALEINKRLLSQCKPDEILVERVKLKNQLRANYAFWDKDEIKRLSCPISGIAIVQDRTLPRYVWRDDPEITGIKMAQVNRVSKIDANPLISQLGLYRYAQ